MGVGIPRETPLTQQAWYNCWWVTGIRGEYSAWLMVLPLIATETVAWAPGGHFAVPSAERFDCSRPYSRCQ